MPNTPLLFNSVKTDPVLIVDGFLNDPGKHRLSINTGGEPLEDGRDVTDHAVARQEEIFLTGFVSDYEGEDRPGEAWETLRRLHKELEPVDVQTAWGHYPEMLIRRAEGIPVGRGLEFTLELEQVIRVGIVASALPPENVEGGAADGRSGEVQRGRVPLDYRELRPEDVSG